MMLLEFSQQRQFVCRHMIILISSDPGFAPDGKNVNIKGLTSTFEMYPLLLFQKHKIAAVL